VPERRESWQERWKAINEILESEVVRNQVQLVKFLKQKGFRVTQSSISRDLAEMGAAKVEGRYISPQALVAGETTPPGLAELGGFILQAAPAGPHLLVVKTTPGVASSVALALDRAAWPEVVGTIAGDDAIFVAVSGRAGQLRIETRLTALMEGTQRG
jgi:transcriptional regulator of arginine metabolism